MDPTLREGATQGLVNMLGLKPGENVCIVTDRPTMKETENAFVEVAREITGRKNVVVYVLEDYGQRPLAAVPDGLEADAKKADVTMFVAEAHGTELETVRKPLIITATRNGAAHGHCPGFTREMMSQGMAADYNVVYALSAALHERLTGAHRLNLITAAGTNLVIDTLKHFPWTPSAPVKRGEMANLPDGEIFCYPNRVEGCVVFDGCVGDSLARFGDISATPIYVEISASMATDISCPNNRELAEAFRTYVWNQDGKREFMTRRVGEAALGTNLGITTPIGNLLQDEKLGNAAHIAFGDPLADHSRAGYSCKGHIDGLIMKPTVSVDGEVIMDQGQYTEAIMRRALRHLPAGYRLASDRTSLIRPEK